MLGIAKAIKPLGHQEGWHSGTYLYHVCPAVCVGDETTEYIIVAISPETADYGQPETKCFAADMNGKIFNDKFPDSPDIDLKNGTIRGYFNPELALKQLGYSIDLKIQDALIYDQFILGKIKNKRLVLKIQKKLLDIVLDNIFIDKNIVWKPFFKYSSILERSIDEESFYYGFKSFKIDGAFWNSEFSAKNGSISVILYLDIENENVIDVEVDVKTSLSETSLAEEKSKTFLGKVLHK